MEALKKYPCPECGGEMEPGYITSVREIDWVYDIDAFILHYPNSEAIMLSRGIERPFLLALRCKKCKLAVMKYSSEYH